MSENVASAERILRRFARVTNLQIAGRRMLIEDPDADPATAAALARMGSALGMRIVTSADDDTLTVRLGRDEELLLGGSALPQRPDAAARIDHARRHMPALAFLAASRPAREALSGVRLGVCLPLEPKTAVLALTLAEAGAQVSLYAHPDEFDAEVAHELIARGVPVASAASMSPRDQRAAAREFLQRGHDVIIDDGAHLIRLGHELGIASRWIGASEETTSGVDAALALDEAEALETAVVFANDAPTKTHFDNRYGTAQSCVFAIADLLEPHGFTLRDHPVTVIGYGPVGQGVAAVAAALGAEVRVCETDAVRALVALHDGFVVGTAEDLVPDSLAISCTGAESTLSGHVLASAWAVTVAGGVPHEADLRGMDAHPLSGDETVLRLASGTLVIGPPGAVNFAAEGNPVEIMDLSFATQLAAVTMLLEERPEPGVYQLDDEAVAHVARTALAARGLTLDVPMPRTSEDGPLHSPRFTGGTA